VFLGASTVVSSKCLEAEMLETLACRKVISLVKDLWSLEDGTRGTHAHIIKEITESLEEFDKASFYHEARGLNEETHGQGRSVVH
jgi:hypothetical protein